MSQLLHFYRQLKKIDQKLIGFLQKKIQGKCFCGWMKVKGLSFEHIANDDDTAQWLNVYAY